MLPGLPGITRWRELPDGPSAVGVPGEGLERIHVCHVGENGFVSGSTGVKFFLSGSVDGLLTHWLNLPGGPLRLEPAPHEVSLMAPRIEGSEIVYREILVRLRSRGVIPITKIDDETRRVYLQWPPNRTAPAPVSPAEESADYCPATLPGESNALGQSSGSEGSTSKSTVVETRIRWPTPFTGLLPVLSSPDDMYARDRMVAIAEQSQQDVGGAMREAFIGAADWLSEGQSTILQAWLEPIIVGEGPEGALFASEARYNLVADSLEAGLKSPEWQEILGRPMPVRRVWGVPGLCWSLLIDQLEGGFAFRHCKRCGGLIQGRSHKRFCGPEDSVECFRRRRAESKRTGRRRLR